MRKAHESTHSSRVLLYPLFHYIILSRKVLVIAIYIIRSREPRRSRFSLFIIFLPDENIMHARAEFRSAAEEIRRKSGGTPTSAIEVRPELLRKIAFYYDNRFCTCNRETDEIQCQDRVHEYKDELQVTQLQSVHVTCEPSFRIRPRLLAHVRLRRRRIIGALRLQLQKMHRGSSQRDYTYIYVRGCMCFGVRTPRAAARATSANCAFGCRGPSHSQSLFLSPRTTTSPRLLLGSCFILDRFAFTPESSTFISIRWSSK
ncbi:unnamed protein product [Trichogramma brassicae]|uniref:Uncharacterized protein n=1 Tax=Trichogramma brassicae TaxID=86971 RepID=A0A6H5J622_9HYME|nr:unnamed protein product [Trichogramma brassicae]